MRRVAEHLYDLGHRRVLQVRSPTDAHSPFFRVDPYRKAGQVCGLVVEVSDDWILSSQAKSLGDLADHAYRLVYDAAREDRLPTAMLTHSDACAIAAVAAVQDAGLRVPEDVSIVGFDDEMEGRFCRPALTTMRLPDHEIGQAAFEMLCQLMREPRAVIEPRSFDCELVLRKSTGPAPDRN
jgi:LacI family transcriptional regulator